MADVPICGVCKSVVKKNYSMYICAHCGFKSCSGCFGKAKKTECKEDKHKFQSTRVTIVYVEKKVEPVKVVKKPTPQAKQNPMEMMMQQQQQKMQQQMQQNPMMQMMMQKNPMMMQQMQQPQQSAPQQAKPAAAVKGEAKEYIQTLSKVVPFAVNIEKEKSYRGECRQGYCFWLPKIGFPGEFLDMNGGLEYIRCSEVCTKIIEFMEEKEKELGGPFYPNHEETKEQMKALSKVCIAKHGTRSVRLLLSNLFDEHKKKDYLAQLERFPGALEYVQRKVVEMKYSTYADEMWKLPKDKKYALPDLTTIPSSGLPKYNDSVEDYLPKFELIRPCDPKDAIRPGKLEEDTNNRNVWTDFRKRHTGEIIFSASPIGVNESQDTNLAKSFVFGKDEIHARVIWAHAIRHFAIARDKVTNELLYPALQLGNKTHFNREDFTLRIYFHLFVDGKKVVVYGTPMGEIHTLDQREDSRGTNYYKTTQCCRLYISLLEGGPTKFDIFSKFQSRAQKFNAVFHSLGAGKHDIRIEMSYRLLVTRESINADQPLFPTEDTLLSHPLAVGNFQLEIPSSSILPNPFPKYSCVVPNGNEIVKEHVEKFLLGSKDWGMRPMKEELIYCIAEGDMYPLMAEYWDPQKQKKVKYIQQYGLEIRAAFYRNPQYGWDREHCAIFKLVAYTPPTDKVDAVKKMPPIVQRLGVGGSTEFDCDYVPEEVWKLSGVERCPPQIADFYKNLKEEDLKFLGKNF